MIANISSAESSFEETLNTLKYANRAKNIKSNVQRNVLNVNYHISEYVQLIENLRGTYMLLWASEIFIITQIFVLLFFLFYLPPSLPSFFSVLFIVFLLIVHPFSSFSSWCFFLPYPIFFMLIYFSIPPSVSSYSFYSVLPIFNSPHLLSS